MPPLAPKIMTDSPGLRASVSSKPRGPVCSARRGVCSELSSLRPAAAPRKDVWHKRPNSLL